MPGLSRGVYRGLVARGAEGLVVAERVAETLGQITEQAADGQGEDPRPEDALDDAPFDGAETLHRADAHDGGRNRVRG